MKKLLNVLKLYFCTTKDVFIIHVMPGFCISEQVKLQTQVVLNSKK